MIHRCLRGSILGLITIALAGCRGEPPGAPEDELAHLVDSLRPAVEEAAGLEFRDSVKSATRSREQVRAYLVAQLDEQLPPARLKGIEAAYHLFGLLPDSVQLRPLLLDVLTEQVAGYYDPDSSTLYGVSGQESLQLKAVAAHELVHALQDQYFPLDSILSQRGNADRAAAAQAVLEGQAHYASVKMLVGGAGDVRSEEFWVQMREQVRQAQRQLPGFAEAPVAIREELLFPYISGSEFMRWWFETHGPDALPFDSLMPVSTEQIMYPERSAGKDPPLPVRFIESDTTVIYEDTVGELGLATLAAEIASAVHISTAVPYGWGGDRYRIYSTPAGNALVWYILFDDASHADRFHERLASAMERDLVRPGYRFERERIEIDGHPGVRIVFAPEGWGRRPEVAVTR